MTVRWRCSPRRQRRPLRLELDGMAWTTMHFATGMAGAGLAAAALSAMFGRGWRWTPLAMTAGGFWALVPDLPRIFREDFPSLPLAAALGNKTLEEGLHGWGDLFFFHHALDAQPHEYALHGLLLILLLYNAAVVLLMALEARARRGLSHGT